MELDVGQIQNDSSPCRTTTRTRFWTHRTQVNAGMVATYHLRPLRVHRGNPQSKVASQTRGQVSSGLSKRPSPLYKIEINAKRHLVFTRYSPCRRTHAHACTFAHTHKNIHPNPQYTPACPLHTLTS